MPRRDTVYRIVCAAVFILMEVAAFTLVGGSGRLQSTWILRAANSVRGALWGVGENIGRYISLGRENKNLSEENIRLHMALMAGMEEEDRQKADSLAEAVNGYGCFNLSPANIVKMSRNSQHNYIILDKGSEDGIQEQSGIITPYGVVGIVNAVGKHFCYGISFLNKDLSVSARLGRDGIAGPLEWKGSDTRTALLKDIPMHYEVTPGDTVWTSGYSDLFPAGIPLGTAGEVNTVGGTSHQVTVSLFQDFYALRTVIIATNTGRDEIHELEKREGRR